MLTSSGHVAPIKRFVQGEKSKEEGDSQERTKLGGNSAYSTGTMATCSSYAAAAFEPTAQE